MRNMVLGLAALVASGSAQAATVVVSGQAVYLAPGLGLPTIGSIELFNGSLGTLNSVTFDVSGNAGANVFISLNQGSVEFPTLTSYDVGGFVNFTIGGIGTYSLALDQQNFPARGQPTAVYSSGTTSFSLPSSTFAAFSAGGTRTLIASGGVQVSANAVGGDPFSVILGDTSQAVSLTITYDYTPTEAVPEPATWAMMIAGFGMIGAATRRSRRTAAMA